MLLLRCLALRCAARSPPTTEPDEQPRADAFTDSRQPRKERADGRDCDHGASRRAPALLRDCVDDRAPAPGEERNLQHEEQGTDGEPAQTRARNENDPASSFAPTHN